MYYACWSVRGVDVAMDGERGEIGGVGQFDATLELAPDYVVSPKQC